MFLHLVLTELQDKFAKPWINEWERVEPNNHFYVRYRECSDPRIRVGETPFVSNVSEFREIISDYSDVEGVLLSGHQNKAYLNDIINAVPLNIPICLVSWGGFRSPEFYEKTRRYLASQRLIRILGIVSCPSKFFDKVGAIIKRKILPNKNEEIEIDFYKRIDIFASCTKREFEDYVKNPYVSKNVVYQYGTVGLPTSIRIKLCDGNAIQIGNSANILNNHLDLFEMVKPLVKKGVKIIVPLTYGDDQTYKNYIIKRGAKLFGDDFVPLTKHLPYDEYQNFLDQCGFFVSGQTTITSLGNLNLAFRRGAKVFMPKTCPMYEEYKNQGIPVFSLEEDLKNNPNAFTEFTAEEKLHCQNKFYEYVNAERSLEGCRNILALLRKMRAERANDPRFN